MLRFLPLLLFLSATGHSQRGRGPSWDSRCVQTADNITWAAGKLSETRAVNMSGCVGIGGLHMFKVNRPVNSTKFMRARIVSLEEDSDAAFEIQVHENGVGEDGTPLRFRRKDLVGVDDYVISSPYTSLEIMFYHSDTVIRKAEAVLVFTLEEEGCPFPFLESRIGSPLIISAQVVSYECDFSVTGVDRGSQLELTSINESLPHQRHSVSVVVYDGYLHTRLHRVEQSEFDTDLKEHLGTNKITIHVTNPMEGSKEHESFITINSIPDDCQCPDSKAFLNTSTAIYKFKIEKHHCFHLNCSVLVQMDEPLRHSYRLKVDPNYHGYPTSMFALRDGGSTDYLNLGNLPRPNSFTSVHPSLVLIYNEGPPSADFVEVYLEPTSEEQQALCVCPQFLPDNTLTVYVDPSCPPMDCLWSLPKIDSKLIPKISVTSSDHSAFDTLYLVSTHGNTDRVVALENGFNEAIFFPAENETDLPHVNIMYHRMRKHHPSNGRRQNEKERSRYHITLSSHYNLTDYENACGCFNKTVKVDPASTDLIFSSPQYPLHYCNNLNCRTVFEAPQGYKVVFRPAVLSLQKEADYLNVYDIIDGKEIRRESYTGTYLDGFTTDSRTNVLLTVFTSDGSINYDGFNGTVFAVKLDEFTEDYDDDHPSTSGGWFWKIILSLLLVGAVVGTVLYRRRQRGGLSLSFTPASFMNQGGDFDDGSVSFALTG